MKAIKHENRFKVEWPLHDFCNLILWSSCFVKFIFNIWCKCFIYLHKSCNLLKQFKYFFPLCFKWNITNQYFRCFNSLLSLLLPLSCCWLSVRKKTTKNKNKKYTYVIMCTAENKYNFCILLFNWFFLERLHQLMLTINSSVI
jgi:hypothetical protein